MAFNKNELNDTQLMDCVELAFSGGKDSTVLLDIARTLYDFPAVFADTGLEYPEIKEFVKTKDNVVIVRPKMSFKEVIEKNGYPVISKEQSRYIRDCQNPTDKNSITRRRRMTGINAKGEQTKACMISQKWKFVIESGIKVSEQCCDKIKKEPLKRYSKENNQFPLIGTMACESNMREKNYKKQGCILINDKIKQCSPLMFWREQDIWDYIKLKNLPYASIYDTGVKRTGCIFCMFGVHLEKGENRFEKLSKSHPQLWDYCMYKLGLKKVLEYINVKTGEKT